MMLGDNIVEGRGPRQGTGPVGSRDTAFGAQPEAWSGGDSSQGVLDLAVYWRLALKHRIVILGCFFTVLALGAALTFLMTPIFTAKATLQIDREAARIFNSEEVTPSESMIQGEEFFQTQYGLLRSRSLAERVIDSLNLASSDEALKAIGAEPPSAGGSAAEQAERRRAAALEAVEENLSISPVRGSRLVSVGFDNPDPLIAANVANGFAENFIQANLDRKFESSKYAREFLEERIAQTKDRLEAAERQLVAYAVTQQIVNVSEPGQGSTDSGSTRSLTASNLVALNDALSKAHAERVAAEERWRSARTTALMTLPEVLGNPAIQRLTEQRAVLNASYQQKLSIYQPDYPEMVQL